METSENVNQIRSPYPVSLRIPQQERYSRWLALATLLLMIPKILILIPHLIVIYVLGIAAFFAFVIAQVVVLFTGKYPRSLFDFVTGYIRWHSRVSAYIFGLTDSYPPFQLRD